MKQVFSMEGTKEIDKQTIEKVGIPSIVLMENYHTEADYGAAWRIERKAWLGFYFHLS